MKKQKIILLIIKKKSKLKGGKTMKKEIKAEDLNLRQIISLLSFRKKREAIPTYNSFWGCPTCHNTIESEGSNYCSYCGQKLSWNNFYKKVMKIENKILHNRIEIED